MGVMMNEMMNDIEKGNRIRIVQKAIRATTTAVVFVVAFLLAGAVYAVPTIITKADDPRIEELLNAIDSQNFDETDTTAEEAKALIRHLIFTSNFKAVGGGKFPYPNGSKNYFTIDDGFYKKTITGARGCMAYARFVGKLIYGSEGKEKLKASYKPDELKDMLQTYGQAGDHIRSVNNHSLIFISCTDEGFYTLDYVNLKNLSVQLAYWSYAEFLDYKLYKGHQLLLYDANPSENAKPPVEGETPAVGEAPAASETPIEGGASAEGETPVAGGKPAFDQ